MIFRTNFDKYHPGYFGKVGMRHYHLTNNQYWRPIINVDKLWSLVPEEQKKGLTENSDVVPVIDTLRFGYGKVLGNGVCVQFDLADSTSWFHTQFLSLPVYQNFLSS